MRVTKARIQPLDPKDMSEETREIAAKAGKDLNIFRTMANHPKMLKKFLVYGGYILAGSTLPARERELVILRIGYLCQAGYEWTQHVRIAREAGMSDEEIRSCVSGPQTPGLSAADKALLQATDELHHDQHISDAAWAELAKHFSKQQMMDMVMTAGQYTMVSMALNSFGVQLEEGEVQWNV